MIWVALAAAVILLTGTLRAGVIFEYSEAGAFVRLKFGPFAKALDREKKTESKKSRKPKKEKKSKKEKTEKNGGDTKDFKTTLSIILKALGKLKRRLVVDELTLWYQSACEDPALAAVAFGAASAAVGTFMPPLSRTLNIKKQDIRTSVSFTEKKNRVYFKAVVTAPVFALIATLIFYFKESKVSVNKGTEVS